MGRVEARVLKGFRDYLPDVMAPREGMLRVVSRVFEGFGFAPLMTPALEYSDVLLGKYGAEGEKLLYRFDDNGGRDVSLRYDLTVPLARVVAQHRPAVPFRRYQIAPVWRAEKPGRGRFREFVQCDVDIVGSESLLADFECVQVGCAVLEALGVGSFVLRINDRRVLDGLMARIGVTEASRQMDTLRVVDKLPKVGWDAVRTELEAAGLLAEGAADRLHTFLHGTLDSLDETVVDMALAAPGIAALRQLLAWGDDLGIRHRLEVDLSIARGLDYYTSTIYETFLTELDGFGSVMSGGRYDGLMGTFTGETIPAVGISLGVDRLLAGLVELGLLVAEPPRPDIYVTVFDEAGAAYAHRVAAALRQAGLSAQLHLEAGQKLKKQLRGADRAGAAFVVVAGPDERDAGRVTVKHMAGGEQGDVALSELVGWIRARASSSAL